MCLAVYVAASSPLPILEFRDDEAGLFVMALTEDDESVREKFSAPYVVYVGSHTGCGCGFNAGRGEWLGHVEPDEHAASLSSSERLIAYMREHGVRELYVCWEGDFSLPAESERRIQIEELLAPEFAFKEREKLIVVEGDVP